MHISPQGNRPQQPDLACEWVDVGQRQKGRLKSTQLHLWPLSMFGEVKKKRHLLAFAAFLKLLGFWPSHLLPFHSSKCHKVHTSISRNNHRKGSKLEDIYLTCPHNGVDAFVIIVTVIYSFIPLFTHSLFFFTTLILDYVKR